MTCNPLIVVEGDGWMVWCAVCDYESPYTPYKPLAQRYRAEHLAGLR